MELKQYIKDIKTFHNLILPIIESPLREMESFRTPDFHWELYNNLQKDERLQLLVAPVGFAKSTILKIFVLHESLVKRQDRYIIYVSSTYTKAIEHVASLQKVLKQEFVKAIFQHKVILLNESEIIIEMDKQTYKIEAVARGEDIAGKNFEGQRPSLIIIDDLEDLEQARSKERTDKLEDWFHTILLSRLPTLTSGRVRMINTVLSLDSLTNRILGKSMRVDMYSDWSKYFYQALDQNGRSIWEDRHPTEALLREKELKPHIFASNYMNEPLDSSSSLINYEDLRFYDILPKMQDLSYIHADTTHTGKQTSDYFGVACVGKGIDNNYYLIDFVLDKIDPERQANTVINFYLANQQFKVKRLTYDAISNDGFGFFAKKLAKDRDISLPLEPKKYPKDKVSHLMPHIPHFKANRFYLPKNHPQLNLALNQLLAFPQKGVNDDFCFPENSKVMTKSGMKDIKDLCIGDLVLSGNGVFNKVLATSASYFKGDLISFKSHGNESVYCTPNHPIKANKINSYSKYKLINDKKEYLGKTRLIQDLGYIRADTLKTGMFVETPILKTQDYLDSIDLLNYAKNVIEDNGILYGTIYTNTYRERKNPKSIGVKRYVEVDKEFAFILGYFLAEGSYGSSHSFVFSGHGKEKYVLDLLIQFFINQGINNYYINNTEHSRAITFNSKIWRDFFDKEFGTKTKKKAPNFIFDMNKENKKSFLLGYLFGDGCFTSSGLTSNSISPSISYTIYLLMLEFGINATIRKAERVDKNFGNDQYIVFMSDYFKNIIVSWIRDLGLEKIFENKNINTHEFCKKLSKNIKHKDCFYKKIINMGITPYEGYVYNLKVANDSTYTVNGITVHNCDMLSGCLDNFNDIIDILSEGSSASPTMASYSDAFYSESRDVSFYE